MSSENNNSGFSDRPPDPPQGPQPGQPAGQPPKDQGTFAMEYRHTPVSARVPERVSRGVMSTGVLVLDGPTEFVLDFMQGLTRPLQVASRVVIAPAVMEQLVMAVRDNLNKYTQRFGPPPTLPKPPNDRRPTLQEIYDEFKLPDDQLSGTYANAVMVGHSPSEFFFDFITNFYPTSAVSSRVFLSAAQLPRLLDALTMAYQRFQQRLASQNAARLGQQPPAPPADPSKPPTEPPPQLL